MSWVIGSLAKALGEAALMYFPHFVNFFLNFLSCEATGYESWSNRPQENVPRV
jgi:hypothetical protein